MKDPWSNFRRDSNLDIVDLGRPAVFLLPFGKARSCMIGKLTVSADICQFLLDKFGAFTVTELPYVGLWRNNEKDLICDRCLKYEVSFVGPERIPVLMERLARIAGHIGEDCIYFKAGEDTCLIMAKK